MERRRLVRIPAGPGPRRPVLRSPSEAVAVRRDPRIVATLSLLLALGLPALGGCGDGVGGPGEEAPPEEREGEATPPDGTIIFRSDREFIDTPVGASRSELYRIRSDGTDETPLTDNDVVENISNFHVAPDGRTVVFEHWTLTAPELTLDVSTVDLDGNLRNLTNQPPLGDAGGEFLSDARWAPDGSGFLVSHQSRDWSEWEIEFMSRDGSIQGALLPPNTTTDWKPRWSPDGTRVAFLSSSAPEEGWKVHVADADGTDHRRVCHAVQCDTPRWSPDGRRIVFAATEDQHAGPWEIWSVSPDGTDLRRIVASEPGRRDAVLPEFSPDGSRLAFSAVGPLGDEDLFLLDLRDGTVETILTARGRDREARFSPDGEWIVYSSERAGALNIFVMEIATRTERQVTFTKGNSAPVWVDGR